MGGGASSAKKQEQEQALATELKRIIEQTHYELLTPDNIIRKLEEYFQAKLNAEQRTLIQAAVEKSLASHFRTRYRVGAVLGKGGYSVVHECSRRSNDPEEAAKKCAVKVIDKTKLSNNALKSLTDEINIMERLKHPRLIRLHDVYDHGNTLYMVMEKVEGGELFDEIVRLQRYSERDAAELMFNFCDGLNYMHGLGYVHRDIKPENILLLRKPQHPQDICRELKIADFGFSALVGDEETLTTCCGTPRYIAPEVLSAGLFHQRKGYGKTCDLWAVGVIAFILLFGKAPFYHKDRDQLWRHICHGVWQMPPEANLVSHSAQDFIRKLIVVDTTVRYTCPQALKHDFLARREQRPDTHLQTTHDAIKDFNGLQKFKGAVFGMQSLSRVAYIQKSLALGVKTNTSVMKQFDTGQFGDDTEVLDFSKNYVGAKGLMAVLEMVKEGCPKLHTVSFAGNNINNAVVEELCQVALKHPSIHTIDLQGNPLSYKAGQALLNLVKKNSRIRKLVLVDTKIQEGLKGQIERALARNQNGGLRDYFAQAPRSESQEQAAAKYAVPAQQQPGAGAP